MTLNEYQTYAARFAKYPRRDFNQGLCYTSIALAGEAGEVCNEVKKYLRRDGLALTNEEHSKLRLELGDVLWYLSALAKEIGVELDEIALANLEKLRARHG